MDATCQQILVPVLEVRISAPTYIRHALARDVIDQVVPVTEKTAVSAQIRLAREEGISAGISSGAALAAALHVANKSEMAGKRIVVVLPDLGERYVTSTIFRELAAEV